MSLFWFILFSPATWTGTLYTKKKSKSTFLAVHVFSSGSMVVFFVGVVFDIIYIEMIQVPIYTGGIIFLYEGSVMLVSLLDVSTTYCVFATY